MSKLPKTVRLPFPNKLVNGITERGGVFYIKVGYEDRRDAECAMDRLTRSQPGDWALIERVARAAIQEDRP